jgi:flagellar motor switch protein FliN/FliY
MTESMTATVDAMFSAAAGVIGSLVDRPVTSSAASPAHADASLRIDKDLIATFTEVASAGIGFVAVYRVADFARIIGLMLGSAIEGDLDPMQMSIVSETVQQLSTAMAERLAEAIGADPGSVKSDVVQEAGSFPAPPFEEYSASLDVAGEFAITVTLDFDGVAMAKLADGTSDSATVEPEPAPRPAPAATAVPPPSSSAKPPRPEPQPIGFTSMTPTPPPKGGHPNLDLVHDVPLQISAVLGRTSLSLRDVVALQTGSVFELDKLSSEPIDLYVNNILIARGEVVVVDDKFAVKISELNPNAERV